MVGTRAAMHYAGAALILSILGIIFLTHDVLTIDGNDIAQAGILIAILGGAVTGILGFMSGMVLGRHISAGKDTKDRPEFTGLGSGLDA